MTKNTTPLHQRFYIYLIIFLCVLFLLSIKSIQKMTYNAVNSPICKGCNIVLIVIDPLRADELPCYGYLKNTAPNICEFAQNNTLYKNTFSQSSWTLPSIMSLFSSQYPSNHNVFIPNVDVLPATMTTLPMALQNAGYKTTFIGPVNEGSRHVPLDKGISRGFDRIAPYTSLNDAAAILDNELQSATSNKPAFIFIHSFDLRNDSVKTAPTLFPLDPQYTYGYIDPYLRSVTLKTQESKGNITSYRRIYDERLRQLDEQFPAILQSIAHTNTLKNTVVALTSNHGDEFGEHGQSSHGNNLYKTVTHVPFILAIPNQKPKQSNNIIQSIDIYPTLLSAVGVRVPSSVRGVNVLLNSYTQNVIQNPYSISQLEPEKNLAAIRNHEWAYYFSPSDQPNKGILYNLLTDPNETSPMQTPDQKLIDLFVKKYHEILSKK